MLDSPIAILFAISLAFGVLAFVLRYGVLRRQIDRLEKNIQKLRGLAATPITFRPVPPGEAAHAERLAALDAAAGELTAAGLEVLGDAIGSRDPQPVRWFVDRERTTFGWFGVLQMPRGRGTAHVAILLSHAGERWFSTRRSPGTAGLAVPPFVSRQNLPATTTLAQALAKHRELAGDPAKLARVETLEEATAAFQEQHARIRAWREQQPPDELLEQDLRSALGRHYDRLAPLLARRFDIALPRARVV